MAERKVLSKWRDPELDESKLPKKTKARNQQVKIRTMLCNSLQCLVCGEYMGKGRKFNARKEVAVGEEYLGIKAYRFYIHCTRCSSELTFKTKPQLSCYVTEKNCKWNYEPSTSYCMEEQETIAQEDLLEVQERKCQELKREAETLYQLELLKERSFRHDSISSSTLDSLYQQRSEEPMEPTDVFTEQEQKAIDNFYYSAEPSTSSPSIDDTFGQTLHNIQTTNSNQSNSPFAHMIVVRDANNITTIPSKKQKTRRSRKLVSLVPSHY